MAGFHDLLSQRLVMRESVVTLPSVSKISSRLRDLKERQDKASTDAFIRELLLYKIETLKATKVLETCDLEIGEYDSLEGDLVEQIKGTEDTIASLEKQLEQEKKIRKHREECELHSREVTKLPSRVVLERQHRKVDDDIKATDQTISDLNDRIQQRVMQFKALLQAIADLKGSLKEEEEMLKLAKAQQGEAGEGDGDEEGLGEGYEGGGGGGEGEGRGSGRGTHNAEQAGGGDAEEGEDEANGGVEVMEVE